MAAPELIRIRVRNLLPALALLLIACGGAARKPRETTLPAPLPAATSRPEAPPEPTPVPVPQPAPAPGTVIVVEEGGTAGETEGGLVAAARAERARREAAGPPVAVITDRNLKEHGRGQRLTEAAPAARETSAAGRRADSQSEERYWRERGRALRERWHRTADELVSERDRAAELRVRFYATDDPFLRDAEIKPAWDRSLEKIAAREREIREIRRELDLFLEEGQRAGALPAWLNDGIELEPPAEQPPSTVSEPGEPTILAEPPR